MSETVVLNDFTTLSYKELRTRKKFLVTIRAEPIIHTFDVMALGKGPAEAIAARLREDIRDIDAMVAPNTLRARETAARAFAAGKRWALKRYSGGKTGPMPPTESTKMFNDSGRLASTLIVSPRVKDGQSVYIINVAANRLDGRTLDRGGDAVVPELFRRLAELVPALSSPESMMSSHSVSGAIGAGILASGAKTAKRRPRGLSPGKGGGHISTDGGHHDTMPDVGDETGGASPDVRQAIEDTLEELIVAEKGRKGRGRGRSINNNQKAWQLARQALGLLRTVWSFG
jgi:hypothetical protein